MKKLSLVAATLILLPTLSLAKKPEKTYKGQVMDSACAKMGNHEAGYKMTGTHTAKDCTLACMKAGSTLVLYNKDTNKTYQLDDQGQAKALAGENVTVKGTLDPSTDTIHVESIHGRS